MVASKTGNAQNKSGIRGVSFDPEKVTAKQPSSPHELPQTHQQTTTTKHPFLPKPPAKTSFHHPRKKYVNNVPISSLTTEICQPLTKPLPGFPVGYLTDRAY
jgi:hypothetical protein